MRHGDTMKASMPNWVQVVKPPNLVPLISGYNGRCDTLWTV